MLYLTEQMLESIWAFDDTFLTEEVLGKTTL
jgi:hypothetical protein